MISRQNRLHPCILPTPLNIETITMKYKNENLFPACHVAMPATADHQRAPFYLAAEEYIAARLPEDNYFFSWILAPTVVMGRNQVARQEINLQFCKEEGIDIIRRKSGGGCIYADNGNIMFSLVTGAGNVEPLFAAYADHMADALRKACAEVSVSGRNDIVLDGHGKICGNAFYHLAQRNIVHGTMLYDTDFRRMSGALHPDEQKLKAAGVKSVRSRVGLLKDVLQLDIEALRRHITTELTNREIRLTEEDMKNIRIIEEKYYEPEYLFGRNAPTDSITRSKRIEGCGRIDLHLTLRDGIIGDIDLTGDFFPQGDFKAAFRQAFTGLPFTADAVKEAIGRIQPETLIRGLPKIKLIDLLIDN